VQATDLFPDGSLGPYAFIASYNGGGGGGGGGRADYFSILNSILFRGVAYYK